MTLGPRPPSWPGADVLQVELVSPEKILFSGEAEMVVARTAGGDIAFQPGHVPFIGTLADHPVRILFAGGQEEMVAVHEGFVECAHDRVTILSDIAELSSQIDVNRAEAARARAEANADQLDESTREAALRRAQVRIQVAGS
ncbi:MAG: ATP synthase F1 subunit epsilon [Acidimicrobiia bacterium]|nr:ATP synthase F1 subunit epsilon [Acidimicrobiia bacterium]